MLLLRWSYTMVNAYLTAAHTQHEEQLAAMDGTEKDSCSMSDAYSKQNDYEIILPPLVLGRTLKSGTVLKRTASFSEGCQLSSEHNLSDMATGGGGSCSGRQGRSSLGQLGQEVIPDDAASLPNNHPDNSSTSDEPRDSSELGDTIVTIQSRYNSLFSNEDTAAGPRDKDWSAVHKRCRTISSLTEDLSEGSIEPLILQSDEATGLTSDINDGSKGLLVNTNSGSSKPEEVGLCRELGIE